MVKICHDPRILSRKARPASRKDARIARKLEETLLAYNRECEEGLHNGVFCIGMASNMIEEDAAIICILDPNKKPLTMLNPVIIASANETSSEEGCVCHEGMRPARRFLDITVEYQTPKGVSRRKRLLGNCAIAAQHEIDHLNGILI